MFVFNLVNQRLPIVTHTDTRFPCTTLYRSLEVDCGRFSCPWSSLFKIVNIKVEFVDMPVAWACASSPRRFWRRYVRQWVFGVPASAAADRDRKSTRLNSSH